MSATEKTSKIFAVVEVWSGVISEIHVFRRRKDAQDCFDELAADHNENENDLQLIRTTLN